MKRGEYFQDNEAMLTDRHGVQLTDDERLVWLAAFGAAAASPDRRRNAIEAQPYWCRASADDAVDLFRNATGWKARP